MRSNEFMGWVVPLGQTSGAQNTIHFERRDKYPRSALLQAALQHLEWRCHN